MVTTLKHEIERCAAQSSEHWTWFREEAKSKPIPLQLSACNRWCLVRKDKIKVWERVCLRSLSCSSHQRAAGALARWENLHLLHLKYKFGLLDCNKGGKSHLCSCVSGALEKKSQVQCPGLVTRMLRCEPGRAASQEQRLSPWRGAIQRR